MNHQASQKQKAMFFALAHKLGYEAEFIKERAKQHFGLESFNDITSEQLSELINRLKEVEERRGQVSDISRDIPETPS